jgi:hypothetical protein
LDAFFDQASNHDPQRNIDFNRGKHPALPGAALTGEQRIKSWDVPGVGHCAPHHGISATPAMTPISTATGVLPAVQAS